MGKPHQRFEMEATVTNHPALPQPDARAKLDAALDRFECACTHDGIAPPSRAAVLDAVEQLCAMALGLDVSAEGRLMPRGRIPPQEHRQKGARRLVRGKDENDG
jgi:hypothetical protein